MLMLKENYNIDVCSKQILKACLEFDFIGASTISALLLHVDELR